MTFVHLHGSCPKGCEPCSQQDHGSTGFCISWALRISLKPTSRLILHPLKSGNSVFWLSCGYDFGERVTHRYDAPFTFTGEIDSVTVDLAGELTKDPKVELKRLMAQQ